MRLVCAWQYREGMHKLSLATVLLSGCLEGHMGDVEAPDAGPADDAAAALVIDAAVPDLAAVDAATAPASVDMARPAHDLASTDLAGLFNCYGVAICDPTQQFCIRLFAGSLAAPGKMAAPACYQPDPSCADNGLPMDCNCIQNDCTLAPLCQNCVDKGDGTFDCYAMP